MEQRFDSKGRQVTVRSRGSGGPVVYLHVFEGDGEAVWDACRSKLDAPFSLVSIGGLAWDDDLSPWPAEATFPGSVPYGGNAAAQLELLERQIVPKAEALLPAPPSWRGIAGYSLGGLFAVWASTVSQTYSHVASASGSLWFPGFSEHLREHGPQPCVQRTYLSVGSKESRVRNRFMQHVEEATREAAAIYESRGIQTRFELNPGGHFFEPDERMARGIVWLLGA